MRLHAGTVLSLRGSDCGGKPEVLRHPVRNKHKGGLRKHKRHIQSDRTVQGQARRGVVGRNETEAGTVLRAGAQASAAGARRAYDGCGSGVEKGIVGHARHNKQKRRDGHSSHSVHRRDKKMRTGCVHRQGLRHGYRQPGRHTDALCRHILSRQTAHAE